MTEYVDVTDSKTGLNFEHWLISNFSRIEQLRYSNDYCGVLDQGDINWPSEYCDLNDHEDDPLGQPEVTVSFNEGSLQVPIEPLEEAEENIFSNCELEEPAQIRDSDLEEQVVPSSQLSDTYEYPEELTILNNIENEENLMDDPESEESNLENSGRYDSQPP